jgi:hypothetical protein
VRRGPSPVTVAWVVGVGVGAWLGTHAAYHDRAIPLLDWLVIAALLVVSALLLAGQPRA